MSFTVKFGEEYSTSNEWFSNSISRFKRLSVLELFKGNVYPSEATNGFNWTSQPILTNSPATQSFSSE